MRRKTDYLELYIIVFALILSLVVLGVFWVRNKGTLSKSTLFPISLVSLPQPVTEPTAVPAQTESPKADHHGLAKILEPGKVNAIVLGDSLAESKGASNKDQTSWISSVAKDLQTQYPGQIEWQFKSGEGFTTNDVLPLVPELSADIDLVILSLGRSDSSKLKLENFRQKYQDLLHQIRSKSPQADIYLLVEPPVKNIQNNNKFFPYRQAILDLGQQNKLQVIDEWEAFINDPTPLSTLLADGVNPNDKGYRIFADTVLKGFKEKLMASN